MSKTLTQDQVITKINRKLEEFRKEFQGYNNIMSKGRQMFKNPQTFDEMAAGLKMVRLARESIEGVLATQGAAIVSMMNTLHEFALAENPPPKRVKTKTSRSRGYYNTAKRSYSGL